MSNSTALFHRPSTTLTPASTRVCSTTPHTPRAVEAPTAVVESTAGAPTAANDNEQLWDGRHIANWPTAKRLAAAKRHDDLLLLVGYRQLTDMAFGTPANDNFRNPAPAPGESDGRAAEEIISEVDMVFGENDMSPTVDEMMTACTLLPMERAPSRRAVITRREQRTGAARRELGGLAFMDGSRLFEYQTEPGQKWKKPQLLRNHHRNKKRSDPAIVPNMSGTWELDDVISARQELRLIYDKIPASSVRLLELALGSTKAVEVGEAFGKRGKNAERFGVRLIDRALGHLADAWSPQNAFCA